MLNTVNTDGKNELYLSVEDTRQIQHRLINLLLSSFSLFFVFLFSIALRQLRHLHQVRARLVPPKKKAPISTEHPLFVQWIQYI